MAGALISRRGLLVGPAAALLAVIACALAAPAPAAAAGGGCANADVAPNEASPTQLRKAVVCLVNKERVQRGRAPVRLDNDLEGVAQRHTERMRKDNCFKHKCRGEAPLAERIESSGYLKPGDRYEFGENLGCAITPAAMVRTWMDGRRSPQRGNILGRGYRHLGVGVVKGAPRKAARKGCRPTRDFATYTALFASKD